MPIFVEVPKAPVWLAAAIQHQLRLVFFGTPQFAVPALQRLHTDGWPIAAVVTAPDKLLGRKQILTPSPVKKAATELGSFVYTPPTLKDDAFFATFENLKPDLCIIAAYGKLIPQRYLTVPRFGFLNIHPSLLPLYRGPSPIQSSILNGDTETGMSIMLLDEEMDHGPILAQEKWTIPGEFDTPLCEEELSHIGADLLAQIVPGYIDGKIFPQPQDHAKATLTKKFTREDGKLDWSQPAEILHNRIRALAAEPGTWTTWNDAPLNILKASCAVTEDVLPPVGTVVRHHGHIAAATGDGFLILEEIQSSGSRPMSAAIFINGKKDFVGSVLH